MAKSKKDPEFTVGGSARHVAGGPEMRLAGVGPDVCLCEWWTEDKEFRQQSFSRTALEVTKETDAADQGVAAVTPAMLAEKERKDSTRSAGELEVRTTVEESGAGPGTEAKGESGERAKNTVAPTSGGRNVKT